MNIWPMQSKMMPLQQKPQHVKQTAGDGDIPMPPEYYQCLTSGKTSSINQTKPKLLHVIKIRHVNYTDITDMQTHRAWGMGKGVTGEGRVLGTTTPIPFSPDFFLKYTYIFKKCWIGKVS